MFAYEAAKKTPILRYGFSWDDLSKENFTPYILASKLFQTQFGKPLETSYWYYAGRGLLHLENNHAGLLNMNLDQYQKAQVAKQIEVNSFLDIMVKKMKSLIKQSSLDYFNSLQTCIMTNKKFNLPLFTSQKNICLKMS